MILQNLICIIIQKKHRGNQEYVRTNLELAKGNNSVFSFGTKGIL